MEPPRPPITVTVPGRDGAPTDVLSAGPPSGERPLLPRRARPLALAAAVLLVLGIAVASGRDDPPPPPDAAPSALPVRTVQGVSAAVTRGAGGRDAPYAERVVATVTLQGADVAGADVGTRSPDAGGVTLVDVTARGFDVALSGRSTPVLLAAAEGTSAVPTVVSLPLDVVVTDCSVEPRAPRELLLSLRRGDGPAFVVPAVVAPQVVRLLARLVNRTCRRPSG